MFNQMKSFCIELLILLVCLVLTFIPIYSLFNCFGNFVDIISGVIAKWSIISSTTISVVIFFVIAESKNRIGETPFSFWIGNNLHKIVTGYVLLILTTVSIRNEVSWTTDQIANLLSLQWTIFGFSLTIFLVWNVLIVEFLKKQQPKMVDETNLIQKYELILEKRTFSQEVETMFSTVVLLTLNLLLLLFSTSLVYISTSTDVVFIQNVVRCSFYLTTNSIVGLFFDILKPLKKEKEEMIKANTVSKQEVDNANAAQFIHALISGIKESVMELDPEKYSLEEKQQILLEWREAFLEVAHAKEDVSSKDTK